MQLNPKRVGAFGAEQMFPTGLQSVNIVIAAVWCGTVNAAEEEWRAFADGATFR